MDKYGARVPLGRMAGAEDLKGPPALNLLAALGKVTYPGLLGVDGAIGECRRQNQGA